MLPKDTDVKLDDLKEEFGEDIAMLAAWRTKPGKIKYKPHDRTIS